MLKIQKGLRLSLAAAASCLAIFTALVAALAVFPPSAHAQGLNVALSTSQNRIETGDTFVYSILVSNPGEPQENVEVLLNFDNRLRFLSAANGGRLSGPAVQWNNLSFGTGAIRTLNATMRLEREDLRNGERLTATALAGSAFAQTEVTVEGDETDEQDQDLSITLSDSKDPVEPDENFTYTIEVRNRDSSPARGVEVRLTLDPALEARSASSGGDTRGEIVVWENQTIDANSTRTYRATVHVERGAEDDDVLRTTAFAGGQFAEEETTVDDPDLDDDDIDRSVTVRLSASDTSVEPDQNFVYTVRATNNGNRKVNNVNIDLSVDDDVEILSASSRGFIEGRFILWEELDIDAGETRTLTASVRVRDDAEDDRVLEAITTAEGSVDELDIRVEDRNEGREDIRIFAFSEEELTEAGAELTYTIRLRNEEQDTERIDVLAYLDFRTAFVSASHDGQLFDRHVLKWEDVFIDSGETETLTLRVSVHDQVQSGDELRLVIDAGQDQLHVFTPVLNPGDEEEFLNPSRARTDRTSRSDADATQSSQTPFIIDPQGIISATERLQIAATPRVTPRLPVLPATGAPRTVAQNIQSPPAPAPQPPGNVLVDKTADKAEVQPGSTVTYTITVTNNTSTPTDSLTVIDHYDEYSVEITDRGGGIRSDGGLKWHVGQLAPGQTWSATYRVQVSSQLSHGASLHGHVEVQGADNVVLAGSPRSTAVLAQLPQTGAAAEPAFAAQGINHQLRQPERGGTRLAAANHAPALFSLQPSLLWQLLYGLIVLLGLTIGMKAARRWL